MGKARSGVGLSGVLLLLQESPPMPLHGSSRDAGSSYRLLIVEISEQTLLGLQSNSLLGLMFIPITLFQPGDASGIPVLSFMLQTSLVL